MRKLGLDLGSKSCGIAVSDPLGITAQGRENFRFEEFDWKTLVDHLEPYLPETEEIILGYPLLPSGDKSKTTFMIEEFKEYLASRTDKKIIYQREFGSTKKAHAVMIEAGLTRKKRKNYKDKLAAVIILQDYLNGE